MLLNLSGISSWVIIAILLPLSFSGCSTPFLTKEDYRHSLHHFYHNRLDEALKNFPVKEKDTFITTMEKTYLNLLNGNPYIADLEKYAGKIENRVRVDISDEIKSFFYIETPEGYYASEHEVIWLHMLLSWGYSLRGEYEKACVEARKAGHLLSAPWSEEGYFDDPMLRIFLAGLWTMCGSWEDARVDLRRAWDLDNSLDWALELAERDVPPANIIFILGGVGPLLYWDPESNQNPLRGWRHISFQKQGRKSDGYLRDSKNVTLNMLLSPDSSNWYQRHWLRNNAIKELIDDSKYGQRILVHIGINIMTY